MDYIVDDGINTIQSGINEFYNLGEDFCICPNCSNLNDVMFWYYTYHAYYTINKCDDFYFGVSSEHKDIGVLHRVKRYNEVNNRIIVRDFFSDLLPNEKRTINKYEYLLDQIVKIDLVPVDLGLYNADVYSEMIGYDIPTFNESDQHKMKTEIQMCGLIPKNVEHVSVKSTIAKLEQPRPLSVNVIKTTTYNKSSALELIDNILMCKHVFGECNETILLSTILLGIDNCVYMDDGASWVNNVYPFFSNRIYIADGYRDGSVANTLGYLYTKEFV